MSAEKEFRRRLEVLGIVTLFALVPAPARGQDVLSAGMDVQGRLDDTDLPDEDGYLHDLFVVEADSEGRIRVRLESPDFDPLLEWGVLRDDVFQVMGVVDDSKGLASPTDARLWLDLSASADAPIALRVTSYEGGPAGAYRIRLESAESGELDIRRIGYDGQTTATLSETDGMVEGRFADVYRFEGREGERALVALEADFDAYLEIRAPSGVRDVTGPWEDDDGFGGTDAFLEVDLPVDGEYEIVATSYAQQVGRYTIRIWDEPALVPAVRGDLDELAAAGAAYELTPEEAAGLYGIDFTEEERTSLEVVDGTVRSEALGFRFPAPVAGLRPSDRVAEEMGMTDTGPNVHAWPLATDDGESTVVVMAIKTPGPVTRGVFEFMADSFSGTLGTSVGTGVENTFEEASWEDRAYELGFVDASGTSDDVGTIFCRATDDSRAPGLMLCLLGASTDGSSFIEAFRALAID